MTEYPTGTITFLMTDIEGSTLLWERHPDAMRAVLIRHDALIERIVEANHGVVVRPRGEGDSRFAVFEQAAAAVRAAVGIQQELAAAFSDTPFELKVRAGLHTGAADWRMGDYYGSAVNRCARIRGLGHGGQTLLSQVTAELVRDEPLDGIELLDLGTHRLKGLIRPEKIYQLAIAGLPNDFPPLQSPDSLVHNLPLPTTSLIGRGREVAEVVNLLLRPEVRLVTLTGPGGTGKTRLSLAVGQELLEWFPQGLFFVDLSPITDPALVATTIAHTMGIREGGGLPPLENLKRYLSDKGMLLLLDNWEQVVAAAPVVAELLAAAPKVKVLATSRIALHLRGEREYPVDTLRVPPENPTLKVVDLLEYEAVQLFVQQAQAVRPSYEVTAADAAAVAGITRRLDGLPLAIEIAAARTRMLPPPALLRRLDQSLKLLVGGAADLPARQQTLRNAIEWSYNLLEPDEQTLFARLSVFVGGFTLESAEVVVNPDGALDLFSGVETLLANSLLRRVDSVSDEPRFAMLQTIHDYAREKLEAAGELATFRRIHAHHYIPQAATDWMRVYGPHSVAWLETLEEEYDNYRAAILWGLESGGDPAVSAQVCLYLVWFWYRHGHFHEGRKWSERAVAATKSLSPLLLSMALLASASMAMWEGDFDVAIEQGEEAVRSAETAGFDSGIAMSRLTSGVILINQGNDQLAFAHFVQAVERFDQAGDAWQACTTLIHLANVSLGLGDFREATAWLDQALPAANQMGDPWQIAFCLNNYGEVARAQGDYVTAGKYYQQAEALYRQADSLSDHTRLIHTLGYIALHDGDDQKAKELFQESLIAFRELGNKRGMAECLTGLASVAAERGDAEWAMPLFSAAGAQLASFGAAYWPADRVEVERTRQRLWSVLGATEFQRLWEQGQAMNLDQAIAYAAESEQSHVAANSSPVFP
jgi:predicted ATPase/class 3 adenylate cyclase